MQITNENIGDTLCLYESAKHIRILEVNPQFVYYATEDGFHYATDEHSAAAFPVTDPARISVFDEHYMLGKVLNSAEYKAFIHMMTDPKNGFSNTDRVLSSIREQQKNLSLRVKSVRARAVPGTALASQFLSSLCERPSGSHDTFWGHKVQLLSNWTYEFQIDGEKMDYELAKDYLSKVHFIEPAKKMSLNDTINAAMLRQDPGLTSEIHREPSILER